MNNENSKTEPLDLIVNSLGIGNYEKHFFLCTGPKCCREEEGLRVWTYLKKRLKETGLEKEVYRTKVNCLRICRDGPIGLLYPDGSWYQGVDEAFCERLIQEVFKQKKDLADKRIARNPL